MRNVLFLYGIDDTNKVIVRSLTPQGVNYVLRGNIDIFKDLSNDPRLQVDRTLLGGVKPLPLQTGRPHVVFNCIADADTNRKTLEMAAQALQGTGLHVLNAPGRVLVTRRDEVADKLRDIPGLFLPAVVRIQPKSRREILEALERGPVTYPAIVRSAGTHGGESMALLHSAADAELLDVFPCDGSEFYLISFVDYRSTDGWYRKMRIVLIDGRPYARHMLFHDDWKVNARVRKITMTQHETTRQEEQVFLDSFDSELLPLWRDRLAAIHARLGLDYCIVDCTLLPDGRLMVFEANAGGNTLRHGDPQRFPYLSAHVHRLREAVFHMLLRPR
ncbi:MAG: ATP-grasp domain-containing protein [Pseudomonadota bacterium]